MSDKIRATDTTQMAADERELVESYEGQQDAKQQGNFVKPSPAEVEAHRATEEALRQRRLGDDSLDDATKAAIKREILDRDTWAEGL